MSAPEIIDIEGEEITKQEWTDADIVAQMCADFASTAGVEEPDQDDEDEDTEPLMTTSQALCAMNELIRLFNVSNGAEFSAAGSCLRAVSRSLQAERQALMPQGLLNRFMKPNVPQSNLFMSL
jgi:hypothetical protein